MSDLVGSLRIRVRTQELQITCLLRKCDHTQSAHLLADCIIAFWPQQLEVVVIDFLIATRNEAAVLLLLALSAIGSCNKGGAIEDSFLSAIRLAVLTAHLIECPCSCLGSNVFTIHVHHFAF